jgi:hypothetical protein
MNAGEIGTVAGRIFEYKLPSNWIFRSQEDQNDHGIDGEIELKDATGKALGESSVFKVQIKGQEFSSFISGGITVSFSLDLERLRYYFSFCVPVILVVVEVSSERIFWVPVTGNEDLIKKAERSAANETIQIHLPVANEILKGSPRSTDTLLNAVSICWDYLAFKGLKSSISNLHVISPDALQKRIEDVGDVFFKAYHQQLDNLLRSKEFGRVYKLSQQLINSTIVPSSDRFVAALYYDQALSVAPFTNIKREQLQQKLLICDLLIAFAREEQDQAYRLLAIGKTRVLMFRIRAEQLYAMHNAKKALPENSIEKYMFNVEEHKLYSICCDNLQKLAELCQRLTKLDQFGILCDVFVSAVVSIILFRSVHGGRGDVAAVSIFDAWFRSVYLLVFASCSLTGELEKAVVLYRFLVRSEITSDQISEIKKLVRLNTELIARFESFDDEIIGDEGAPARFIDLSVLEQKKYFISMAKDLGMDPDDPKCMLGGIVARGLANYDPSEILRKCEHLFVSYRPAGMVAETLRMHSAGGMHLLVCLKHYHVSGTGGLLLPLYDRESEQEFLRGFKQNHCDTCKDCKPRADKWSWSLRWQHDSESEHKDALAKFGSW